MAVHSSGGWALTTPGLVQLLARSGARQLSTAFADHGFDGLLPSHVLVLVPLAAQGRSASELARGVGVTRQAVAQAVTVLERSGYVSRTSDPRDARARLICLTDRGWEALKVMRASAVELERRWAALLGEDRLADLHATLGELASLTSEDQP